MRSQTAAALDDIYDRLHWAGKEYILEELTDEAHGLKKPALLILRKSCTGLDIPIATGIITQRNPVAKSIKLQTQKQQH